MTCTAQKCKDQFTAFPSYDVMYQKRKTVFNHISKHQERVENTKSAEFF